MWEPNPHIAGSHDEAHEAVVELQHLARVDSAPSAWRLAASARGQRWVAYLYQIAYRSVASRWLGESQRVNIFGLEV
eukprot:scaffold94074_cov33-Tisochrysis_lutea.AAC.2